MCHLNSRHSFAICDLENLERITICYDKIPQKGRKIIMQEKFKITSDTIASIGMFSILWGRFELCNFNPKIDENRIKRWASRYKLSADQKAVYYSIQSEADNYLGTIDKETIRERLYSEQNKGCEPNRDLIYKFLTNPDELCVAGCFLFIYRIRNNLFHGLKDIYALNDQKEMIDTICNMLYSVLEKDYRI